MAALDLIIDLHKVAKRQGPGSQEETIRALDLTGLSNKKDLKVVDVGCGSGGQTITLAQQIHGKITAIDLFPDFLEALDNQSKALGLSDQIKTLQMSMEDLRLEKASFDLIWSEGAIYNIGFEAGIKQWRDYLKPQGYLSVSEVTWITNTRPKEVEDFWNQEYPEIDIASNKIKILEENGYTLVGYFYLSESSWLKHYYQPMEARFSTFLDDHQHSEMARKVVEEYRAEIEFYQKYKAYFSYGFYVARKNGA